MRKLITELRRLYLPSGTLSPGILEQHVLGQATQAISLMTGYGQVRAMVIAFDKQSDSGQAQHWSLLCEVANAIQTQLGLPAPAVSISGGHGFGLWLSLATPVPAALVQKFLELLGAAYFPDIAIGPDAATAAVELPPCLNQRTGRWAAFINPGLGASFADESGLEMAPPFSGQAALLGSLESISEAQFLHALAVLEPSAAGTPAMSEALPQPKPTPGGLLLKDATLEDIVRHLHAMKIEPTFRHLIQ